MAAGRPHGPNDPSLMSSLETAVREVRRPGPLALAWNWRWELGIPTTLGALSALIATSIGLNGLALTAGAGLAVSAAALLCWPPARQCVIARAGFDPLSSQAPVSLAASSRSLTERTRSCATSMTSRDCLAWQAAFLALMASPSMTMQ